MSDLFWLTDAQMARLEPFFPKSHGKPRVDDRRVLSGIIFINRNGLRWRDAPAAYGPHKTLYNRWKRWSDKGILARMMAGLAAKHGEQKTVMIPSHGLQANHCRAVDATYLKAHRTATSMGIEKGAWTPDWPNQRRHEYETARYLRQSRTPAEPVRDRRTGQRLHRCTGVVEQSAESRLAARRSWIRCRLVPRSVARQRDTRLHPWPETAKENRQIRQASVQAAQPDRDHVRQVERLAARGNPL